MLPSVALPSGPRVPKYRIAAAAPPVTSHGQMVRDMALRRRGGTGTDPAPQEKPAHDHTAADEQRLAQAGRQTFGCFVGDVAHSMRDLSNDVGETIRQGLGDVPGDIELGRQLVEQVERLGELEAFAPELVILGIDVVDLADLGDLVHVLHHLGPALLERVETLLRGEVAEDAAAAFELLPGLVPVRGEVDD